MTENQHHDATALEAAEQAGLSPDELAKAALQMNSRPAPTDPLDIQLAIIGARLDLMEMQLNALLAVCHRYFNEHLKGRMGNV